MEDPYARNSKIRTQHSGDQSYRNGQANTFGMLGGLAYGLSDKDGLVPKPGEMKKWFNRACIGYSMLFFGPFLIAFAWALWMASPLIAITAAVTSVYMLFRRISFGLIVAAFFAWCALSLVLHGIGVSALDGPYYTNQWKPEVPTYCGFHDPECAEVTPAG